MSKKYSYTIDDLYKLIGEKKDEYDLLHTNKLVEYLKQVQCKFESGQTKKASIYVHRQRINILRLGFDGKGTFIEIPLSIIQNYKPFNQAAAYNRLLGRLQWLPNFELRLSKREKRPWFMIKEMSESKIKKLVEDLTWISDSIAQKTEIGINIFMNNQQNDSKKYIEGLPIKSIGKRFERSESARIECIKFYGLNCSVCDMNFGETYGTVGDGFIHVHHIEPLASIAETYKVDPIKDLRPVCPNCHAMLHKNDPPYGIEELKRFLKL
ncbi:MAG: HNH endonuclease [Saprospiraceae bacterium]